MERQSVGERRQSLFRRSRGHARVRPRAGCVRGRGAVAASTRHLRQHGHKPATISCHYVVQFLMRCHLPWPKCDLRTECNHRLLGMGWRREAGVRLPRGALQLRQRQPMYGMRHERDFFVKLAGLRAIARTHCGAGRHGLLLCRKRKHRRLRNRCERLANFPRNERFWRRECIARAREWQLPGRAGLRRAHHTAERRERGL